MTRSGNTTNIVAFEDMLRSREHITSTMHSIAGLIFAEKRNDGFLNNLFTQTGLFSGDCL
jgi:sensor histidine kinase regulating citrate/malate metabolism